MVACSTQYLLFEIRVFCRVRLTTGGGTKINDFLPLINTKKMWQTAGAKK